jgi:L-ascorbate metabolism protein UlaG (beta-lactamase superfamily)
MNALIREINERQVEPGALRIWWIGQEGFVFKSSKRIIYIDPYLSSYAEDLTRGKPDEHVRIKPAPMRPQDVTHADLVLCTHDHADHIDPEGIPVIAARSPRAAFIVPECARDTMRGFGIADERIHTLRGDDELSLDGIRVHAIPAKHEQFNQHPVKDYPYLSYVINIDGITVFHAGDTIPYDGQAERIGKHRIDLAFLPINGRDESRHRLGLEGNLTCEEAVRLALDIEAGLTIPMHYDMFTLNTADVNEFRRIADKRKLRYLVMDHGGFIHFPLETKDGAQR